MGYTLTIGEATMEHHPEYASLRVGAERMTHPDAPKHCPYTKDSNSRSPSYSGWEDFCKEAGPAVYELFYGGGWNDGHYVCVDNPDNPREAPIMAEHPGYAVLTPYDLKVFREARQRREKTNGGKPPGFFDEDPKTFKSIDNGTDATLARLLWLEFWTEWALKNCKVPILENT